MAATNWLMVLACSSGWLAASCAAPAPARSPTTGSELPLAGATVDTSSLQDRKWGVVRSAPLGVRLALPEARAWLAEPAGPAASAAWELRHEPTGSTLRARRWRSSRLPRVETCEGELRERASGLLQADETNVIARRRVRIPEGFVTLITLLATPGRSSRLEGQVVAVGAGVGECLALVARTECDSEAELAERLRLLDIAVGHVRLMHIEDRVAAPARKRADSE